MPPLGSIIALLPNVGSASMEEWGPIGSKYRLTSNHGSDTGCKFSVKLRRQPERDRRGFGEGCMQAQFELFRFMLVRPPNDAGGQSVSVPSPTGLQKDVAAAANSGSVTELKKAAADYTKSPSFATRL